MIIRCFELVVDELTEEIKCGDDLDNPVYWARCM